ncbi:Hsp20 family protein [Salinimonas sediminis]|uniref:Molecular chaperone n=1 Tax=Salinimonas sediminis TaxID=2303538 RepID=A0A346NNL2_9ALTE|nr:Hsp20 family protein [Salinimonas sediminis]AXR07119.1 molecular chaperone [Salinimonas sediminis]
MRNIDLSPLYRSFIGSDQLSSLIESAHRKDNQRAYPPYNIEVLGDDKYRISMALAGFNREQITVEAQGNTLTVRGKQTSSEQANGTKDDADHNTGNVNSEAVTQAETTGNRHSRPSSENTQRKFLHKGISARNFDKTFQLGDHVKVLGAELTNGLLHVDLMRQIPEANKPRRIQIV